jgi:DNA-binding GntR family transcriptional regulator
MGEDTLKRRIYRDIMDEIITKKYPLDYILREKELAEKFGVSKAPVREALIELCKEDILRSIPRAGYEIVRFTERDIGEATELRLLLELPALDRLINSIPGETLRALYAGVEEFTYAKRHTAVPLDRWWNDNIWFHTALNATAGNGLLTATLETTLRRLWRAIAQLFWSGDPQDYLNFEPDSHRSLLEAIEAKDRKKARRILSGDILSINPPPEGGFNWEARWTNHTPPD